MRLVPELRSDRSEQFGIGARHLWERLQAVDEYRSWWPWLLECDARVLAVGEVWHCAVQAPLSYRVRFVLTIDEVIDGRSVGALVSGDISGSARFEITTSEQGSELRLVSDLAPRSSLLRAVSTVAWPVAHRSHDWILDTGFRQLREHV